MQLQLEDFRIFEKIEGKKMIKLLAKIFIKNSSNYQDVKVREQYGVLCGAVGIGLNIILFLAKFLFGTISVSVAMVADAFNNLSDAASSIIQILGFKLSSKKPDPEHPFGHGRIEYISGLIISMLILLMGFELLKSSVSSILNPKTLSVSTFSIVIMIFAIGIKLYMMIYNLSISKKINSVSMKATATDSFFDCISTFLVLLSLILSNFTTLPVDGIAGVVVSLFILYGGLSSAFETIEPLLGTSPDKDFVLQIEKELLNHKPIVGMHDLVIHDYGPGRLMISLHAEVPGNMNIFELHDSIDVTEVEIAQKFNCHVVIHMDPIDLDNEDLKKYKEGLSKILKEIHIELHAHDVRMVPGITHTNLIFDVVKPFDYKKTDDELVKTIQSSVSNKWQNVCCVITVDQPFTKH